jgi:hypothetical protein
LPPDPALFFTTRGSTQSDADAIRRDPIGLARSIVRFVRASSGRRHAFFNVIDQGNKEHDFAPATEPLYELPKLQLLRDMDVRWDSTFLMIQRVIEMRPVSGLYTLIRSWLIYPCKH